MAIFLPRLTAKVAQSEFEYRNSKRFHPTGGTPPFTQRTERSPEFLLRASSSFQNAGTADDREYQRRTWRLRVVVSITPPPVPVIVIV